MADAAATPARKSRFVGPYHLMLVLLVGTYVALPLTRIDDAGGAQLGLAAIAVVTCAAMLLGIRASRCPRGNLLAAEVIVALLGVSIIAWYVGLETRPFTRLLLPALTFVAIKTILTSVLRAERVDADKIFAAICVLFLLGWFWSDIYVFVQGFGDTDAFRGIRGGSDGALKLDLTYFSFVTLTTLGYGDITPATTFAQSLVTLEALTGQLYLAILVARLVALHILHSNEETDE
jgi:hypothetical protein